MCNNSRNYDVENSSILTVYIYISDDRIMFYLMMSKCPWGGRGAEFLESSGMWYVVGWNTGLQELGTSAAPRTLARH